MIDYKKQWNCIVQFCCCNLSPRGDGNYLAVKKCRCESPEGCNLSPRGDGNLRLFSTRRPPAVAIYPREGTETCPWYQSTSPAWLQFIPARGRKQLIVVGIVDEPAGCNLSPRGDGNAYSLSCGSSVSRLQFIPARGRKLHPISYRIIVAGCNLSPRGDGNVFFNSHR